MLLDPDIAIFATWHAVVGKKVESAVRLPGLKSLGWIFIFLNPWITYL